MTSLLESPCLLVTLLLVNIIVNTECQQSQHNAVELYGNLVRI